MEFETNKHEAEKGSEKDEDGEGSEEDEDGKETEEDEDGEGSEENEDETEFDFRGFRGKTAEELVEELVDAAENGNIGKIKALLRHGVDINRSTREPFDWTALAKACALGHLKVVQLLLDRGAKYYLTDSDGNSPFILACQEGQLEIVQYLLTENGELSLRDKDKGGNTALHWACGQGAIEVAELLMRHGADPFIVNKRNQTAFERCHWPDSRAELEAFYEELTSSVLK